MLYLKHYFSKCDLRLEQDFGHQLQHLLQQRYSPIFRWEMFLFFLIYCDDNALFGVMFSGCGVASICGCMSFSSGWKRLSKYIAHDSDVITFSVFSFIRMLHDFFGRAERTLCRILSRKFDLYVCPDSVVCFPSPSSYIAYILYSPFYLLLRLWIMVLRLFYSYFLSCPRCFGFFTVIFCLVCVDVVFCYYLSLYR